MAKILVTGAAGFIGSHTVDCLLRAQHDVIGVDNFRTGHRENLEDALRSERFRLIEADVSEPGKLEEIVKAGGISAIIHLAALVSVQESIQDPDLNFRLNLQATHLVLEAARRGRIPRIVFASSAAVYGDQPSLPITEDANKEPISPYGAAKLASEAVLHGGGSAFGITTICQRYFNVFGPRQDPASPYSGVISIFHRRYSEGKPPTIFGDGSQSRDFISVFDVARANTLVATTPDLPSASQNICTGRRTTLLDIVRTFAEKFPEVGAPQHAPARSGDILHSCGSGTKARNTTGFQPEVDVVTGLREMIQAA